MKISVLMSVYTKEKPEYLKCSIESILNQTRMPEQIVIIKDGPLTNVLEEILQKYKNQYSDLIEIYELKENKGLGNALQYGIEKCKFEYIARQDSDDVSPKYRFKEQMKVLEQNENIDILGGYIEEYDENMKKLLSIRKVPLEMSDIREYIKKQCPFNHGTVIMKKQAILDSGNYNNTKLEDYDLWARMFISGCCMKNIPVILGKNRTGKSMYKRRSGIKQIKKVLEIEKKLLHYRIINKRTYFYNIAIRSALAIFPVSIKHKIYTKIIRNADLKKTNY